MRTFSRRNFLAAAPLAAAAAQDPRSRNDAASAQPGDPWLRPASGAGPLLWGRRDGIVFGLVSEGGMPGPRGLIRVGIWNASAARAELINFVAVEPVAEGYGSRQSRMGFSEMENSENDGRPGKIFTAAEPAGTFETLPAKPRPIERLSVRIDIEPFSSNRSHVWVTAAVQSDRPREIVFRVSHREDSAPVEELTLTATMGNYARLRRLWLKDRVIDSRRLYSGYAAGGFVDKENYPRDEMLVYGDGDALALATTNETDPGRVAISERPAWTYRSARLTQYWRVPARHIQPDLRVKVNGRAQYYGSAIPIPGGPAFENFEVRQRYVPGQAFVFGLSPAEPGDWRPPIPRLGRPPEE